MVKFYQFRPTTRIVRFAIVGICNAAISFGMLNLCYYHFGIAKIPSSIIATSCAFIFSFIANRNFVFLDKDRQVRKQVAPFMLVTVSGSIVVLNLVYIAGVTLLNHHDLWLVSLIKHATHIQVSASFVDINLSTILGAVVAMIWNYNGYRLFVFDKGVEEIESQAT